MDGGEIELISFEKGIVKVTLKGACRGCPSSVSTLKDGIENKLKSIIPKNKRSCFGLNLILINIVKKRLNKHLIFFIISFFLMNLFIKISPSERRKKN